MRWRAIMPAALMVLGTAAPSIPVFAGSGVAGLGDCPLYGDVHICSGEIPSWDGSPLDVDLTLPQRGTGDHHPLIVMLHGFGSTNATSRLRLRHTRGGGFASPQGRGVCASDDP